MAGDLPFSDYTGERKQTQKRGFERAVRAVAWEHEQILKTQSSLSMTFGSFCEQDITDLKPRPSSRTRGIPRSISSDKDCALFQKPEDCGDQVAGCSGMAEYAAGRG